MYSFSQRIINWWNSLPENVISSETVNQFKGRLNTHWKNVSMKFQPDCYIVNTNAQTGQLQINEDGSERRLV